jgi:hypothetical protein
MIMDMLKPDAGKLVYLLIGVFAVPKVLKMVKR